MLLVCATALGTPAVTISVMFSSAWCGECGTSGTVSMATSTTFTGLLDSHEGQGSSSCSIAMSSTADCSSTMPSILSSSSCASCSIAIGTSRIIAVGSTAGTVGVGGRESSGCYSATSSTSIQTSISSATGVRVLSVHSLSAWQSDCI